MRRVEGIEHVMPMAIGYSRPQLLRADDGKCYVVKFRSNVQGLRVLPNELIAGGCAEALGLPVPGIAIVNVAQELLEKTKELSRFKKEPGLQFGSEYVPRGHSEPWPDVLARAENLGDLAGILVFDSWTNNGDRSWRESNIDVVKDADGHYRIIIFDQGWVFGGSPNWSATSLKERCDLIIPPFMDGAVYHSFRRHVRGANPFDSWLRKLENLPPKTIWQVIRRVPDGWGIDPDERESLAKYLIARRNLVRPVFMGLKHKFPQWL